MYDKWYLKKIIRELIRKFDTVESVFLFGSRAYKTNSKRSDIDLLVKFSNNVDRNKLLGFQAKYPPIDIFINNENSCVSIVNNSSILKKDTSSSLEEQLDAIELWNTSGYVDSSKDYFIQETMKGIIFKPSIGPCTNPSYLLESIIQENKSDFSERQLVYLKEAIIAFQLELYLSFISLMGLFYEDTLINTMR